MRRFRKNYLNRRNLNRTKLNYNFPVFSFFLVLIILLSVSGTVFFSVQLSLIRSKMVLLDLEEKEVLDKKLELEEVIVKKDSLFSFSQKAKDLSFEKLGGNILYFNDEKLAAGIR